MVFITIFVVTILILGLFFYLEQKASCIIIIIANLYPLFALSFSVNYITWAVILLAYSVEVVLDYIDMCAA